MEHVLTAKYFRGFDMVKIDFMLDGSANYVVLGDVAQEDVDALIAAEGANVSGWESEITI